MLSLSKIGEEHDKLWQESKEEDNRYYEGLNNNRIIRKKCRDKRNKFYGLHQKHFKLWNKWFDAEEADDVVLADKIKRDMDKLWQIVLRLEKEWKVLEFQLNIYHHISDINLKRCDELSDKMDKAHNITKKKCCVRNVTKSKMRKLEIEECCICLEQHKIKDILTTSCGHTFGKSCFEKILRDRDNNYLEMICPLCRSLGLDVTIYRRK